MTDLRSFATASAEKFRVTDLEVPGMENLTLVPSLAAGFNATLTSPASESWQAASEATSALQLSVARGCCCLSPPKDFEIEDDDEASSHGLPSLATVILGTLSRAGAASATTTTTLSDESLICPRFDEAAKGMASLGLGVECPVEDKSGSPP